MSLILRGKIWSADRVIIVFICCNHTIDSKVKGIGIGIGIGTFLSHSVIFWTKVHVVFLSYQ